MASNRREADGDVMVLIVKELKLLNVRHFSRAFHIFTDVDSPFLLCCRHIGRITVLPVRLSRTSP